MNKLLQKVAKIFLGLSMAAGVGVAVSAGRKDASPVHGGEVTYKLTINGNDFNTTSYAANNNEKTSNAVCTTDNTKTFEVKWTSYQVMKNSSNMQWQKSKGYIYNSTDLGTINSVTVTSSAGSFTTYYGTSAQPSSGTSGSGKGFFKTSVGGATGTSSRVEVVFTVTEGGGTVTHIQLSSNDIANLDIGAENAQTPAVLEDGVASSGGYTLASSNTSIVSIDGNKVVGVAEGTATITISKTSADPSSVVYDDGTFSVTVVDSSLSTSTLEFTAACGGSGTADDNAAWTVTSDGTESTYDSTSGIHYGTNSANVTYLQLSTSSILGTIKKVTVNTRDAQATATITVTVGGVSYTYSGGGTATATNTSTNYSFTGNSSGEIVVRVDRGSSMTKAIYVKSIVVKYEPINLESINLASTSAGTIALTTATVKTDKTTQVYLTANYSGTGAVDKTSEAEWTATAGTGTASVTDGLIKGLTVGEVTISASFGGKAAVSLTLTVTQGPSVSLSRAQITPFLEKESRNDIEITSANFDGTVTYTASTPSANLTPSVITSNNKKYLQIVAGNTISADETVTVTVTGDDGNDTASAELKVYLKAPVFTLSGNTVNAKPNTAAVNLTATISNFGDNPVITAVSNNTNVATVSVSGTTISVTPKNEGDTTVTVTATSSNGQITREQTVTVGIHDVLVYTKVTDDTALTAGSKLLIVCESSNKAMGAQDGSLRTSVSVTISDDQISGPSSDVKVVELEGESGEWLLKTDEGYLSYAGGTSNNIATVESNPQSWDISISNGNATISPANASSRYIAYNAQNPRFCVYSGQTAVQIYGILASAKEIVSSRMTNGTVSAKTNDTEWTITGFKFFVTYEGEQETEVTSSTTFAVAESVPTINENGTMQVTVTPTYKNTAFTEKAASVTATLTFVDAYAISRLYDIELALNGTQANLTCDGIYMGYITHIKSSTTYYDLFIGNGDYGMEVYETSTNPSSYTIGETYLTVTGTLKNYNYLYEMTSATVTVLTDATRKSHITAPSTYVVDGTESASTMYLASRKTSLSGTIYSIGGNTTAGTTATSGSNNSVYVTVGGTNVLLYIKSAQATSEVASKFVVGNTITVEGFTTYYNNSGATFEVLFEAVVEAEENYHAADFARDLLKLTRATCAASDEGNGATLTGIWTTLAGADYWLKVQAAGESSTLVGGTPDYEIEVPNTEAGISEMTDANAIAAALARYDWCTSKYKLTNFMNRTLTRSFTNHALLFNTFVGENTNTVAIIVIISMVSVTAIGGYFFLRRRKEKI